jgi:hypothetical protein
LSDDDNDDDGDGELGGDGWALLVVGSKERTRLVLGGCLKGTGSDCNVGFTRLAPASENTVLGSTLRFIADPHQYLSYYL